MAAIDRNIQTSIHGRRFGINATNDLIGNTRVRGRAMIYAANSLDPMRQTIFQDDFLGPSLSTRWVSHKGSDGGCVDWVPVAAASGKVNGVTGAGAGATMAVNGIQLDGSLNWYAQNGNLNFEAYVKLSAITSVAWFVGFTDQVSALEMPWTLSVVTFTSTQTDGCGFLFDTAATTKTIRCVGVKNDTDATTIDTAVAYVADTYKKLRIDVDILGNAEFFIDDVSYGVMSNALTKTIALSPVVAGFARSAASTTGGVDYVYVSQDR